MHWLPSSMIMLLGHAAPISSIKQSWQCTAVYLIKLERSNASNSSCIKVTGTSTIQPFQADSTIMPNTASSNGLFSSLLQFACIEPFLTTWWISSLNPSEAGRLSTLYLNLSSFILRPTSIEELKLFQVIWNNLHLDITTDILFLSWRNVWIHKRLRQVTRCQIPGSSTRALHCKAVCIKEPDSDTIKNQHSSEMNSGFCSVNIRQNTFITSVTGLLTKPFRLLASHRNIQLSWLPWD